MASVCWPMHRRTRLKAPLECVSPDLRDHTDYLEGSCAFVLLVLSSTGQWNGRIFLSDEAKQALHDTIDSEECSNACHKDGQLSLQELQEFISQEDNRVFLIEDLPESYACLASEDLMLEAFHNIDTDGSGYLDTEEWKAFLSDLNNNHHTYLLVNAFRQFRAFFGRGQEYSDGGKKDGSERDRFMLLSALQPRGGSGASYTPLEERGTDPEPGAELLPPGPVTNPLQLWPDPEWRSCWQDFKFYSANNHPLHGIFSCSADHPLSWPERLVIEVVTVIFTYFTLWLADRNRKEHFERNAFTFSLLYCTLPGIILWWLLFLLFTCPKFGIVNEAMSSQSDIAQAYVWRRVGAALGYVILVCTCALSFIFELGFLERLGRVLYGRGKAYIIFWLNQSLVCFNPLMAWGQPSTEFSLLGFVGEVVGIGQWRMERLRFQSECARVLQKWPERLAREQELRNQGRWMKPRKIVWEFQADHGYKAYDDSCVAYLERRYQEYQFGGQKRRKVKTGSVEVILDFQRMTQMNVATKKIRPVKRREVVGASGSETPYKGTKGTP